MTEDITASQTLRILNSHQNTLEAQQNTIGLLQAVGEALVKRVEHLELLVESSQKRVKFLEDMFLGDTNTGNS
jgi:hypothetical protein